MLTDNQSFEVLDASELAKRWRVPVSWVREHTRDRAFDPIPTVRLGRYVRFEWGQPCAPQMVGESAEMNHGAIFLLTNITLGEIVQPMKKNPNAVALGKLGGKARAKNLSDAELSAIGKKAAAARNASLSPAERKRIAKLGVAARERKRKQAQEKGK